MAWDPYYYEKLGEEIRTLAWRGLKISLEGEIVTLKDEAGHILMSGPVQEPDYNDKNRSVNPLSDFIHLGLSRYLMGLASSLTPPVSNLQHSDMAGIQWDWNGKSFNAGILVYMGEITLALKNWDPDAPLVQRQGLGKLPTAGELEDQMRQLELEVSFYNAFRGYLKLHGIEFRTFDDGSILVHSFRLRVSQQKIFYHVGSETSDTTLGLELLTHVEIFLAEWKARVLSSTVSRYSWVDTELDLI